VTEIEIQLLKDSIDRLVEIETIDGERFTARVISVFHDQEYDEHELFYEVISSNMLEVYKQIGDGGGYALDFGKIAAVRPHSDL
jgi:hypothetical protein